MFKIGGYKPSDKELDCKKFSQYKQGFLKLAGSGTASEHIIPEYTPISNQASLSSCVSNAVGDGLEILKGLENPAKVEQVSRLFIYYNARIYINTTNQDSGCFIHDALSSLSKLGACREELWPYSSEEVFTHPPIECYREGNANTINDFYQITSSGPQRIEDIEKAIRANHPVVFGTTVGSNFTNYVPGTVLSVPTDSIGGHAMIVTGVRVNKGKREFLIRNSWGDGFGENGHCWFSEDYLMWEQTADIFVPTRMIDFVI